MRRRPPISTLFPYTTLCRSERGVVELVQVPQPVVELDAVQHPGPVRQAEDVTGEQVAVTVHHAAGTLPLGEQDRKSTRLNSSHANISYAVFCLKKKK